MHTSVPPPSVAPTAWLSPRRLRGLSWLGSALMLALAAWLLRRYLGALSWTDVSAALARLPPMRLAAAVGATALSFAMLAAFDVLAAAIVVPRASVRLAAFAGAAAHALSSALGFHALTGGAVRYRIYGTAGIGAGDVARIVSLASLGVGLGYIVLGAAAFSLQPSVLGAWGRMTGAALALTLVGLLAWLARRPRQLRVRGWTLALPRATVAAWQMLIGGVEMSAAIGAMYVLLPAAIVPSFADFVPLYLAAVLAGIVSHAPGGLGVFEAIVLAAFPASARAEVLAALLCYRAIYNLVPLLLALGALAVFEARRKLRMSPV
jgi:uncharacterized membrane protein YbhN (UPF0104 family)